MNLPALDGLDTPALPANVPPVIVKKLAGHVDLVTTMRYYVRVEKEDLRAGIRKAVAAG